MSASSGNANSLINNLCQHPEKFNFFQAIRILAQQSQKRVSQNTKPLRFKSSISLAFPASAIEAITPKFEVVVSFLGLVGPRSALPYHYTELLIKQKHSKDNVLRDFLDIFHHRIISMYYHAWEKYHFWADLDNFNNIISSLTGSDFLPARCYAGLLRQPRSAIILEQILSDYFSLPVCILQFQPARINLDQKNHSRISSLNKNECYNILGIDVVLGNEIHDVQNKFRICLGPLAYTQFQQLLPKRNMLQALCELTRFYVGVNLNFDIKLILQVDEVPKCQLRTNHLLLGWNTWLASKPDVHSIDQLVLQFNDSRYA